MLAFWLTGWPSCAPVFPKPRLGRPILASQPTIPPNGMSDSQGDKPDGSFGEKKTGPKDSQKAIRRNLNNFLNPGLPLPQAKPEDPNAALKLRMAQMELANRMRLGQQNQSGEKKPPPNNVPIQKTPPPGGFGSAHGLFHMKAANFGQNKPSVSKRSPYQQIFANASKPPEEKEPAPTVEQAPVTDPATPAAAGEVLEVPADAEVKQDQKPKRLRGKKFRNPTL